MSGTIIQVFRQKQSVANSSNHRAVLKKDITDINQDK